MNKKNFTEDSDLTIDKFQAIPIPSVPPVPPVTMCPAILIGQISVLAVTFIIHILITWFCWCVLHKYGW